MGYLTQMAGLAVQNFLSAATGIAVAIALIRGFARHGAADHRQFLGRPHALDAVYAAAAVGAARAGAGQPGRDSEFRRLQGRDDRREADLSESEDRCGGNPVKDAAGNPVTETAVTQTQTLPMGPVASQESIKELGTNGGGFFNANSAHPYENPHGADQLPGDAGDVR